MWKIKLEKLFSAFDKFMCRVGLSTKIMVSVFEIWMCTNKKRGLFSPLFR
jgi:hypothetical protein